MPILQTCLIVTSLQSLPPLELGQYQLGLLALYTILHYLYILLKVLTRKIIVQSTALVHVHNDIVGEYHQGILLVLLVMSVAFDTVDPRNLLDTLFLFFIYSILP